MNLVNKDTFQILKKNRGYTNKQIAENARIDPRTVGKIKKGENINSNSIQSLAQALDVAVEVLTGPPEQLKEEKFGTDYYDRRELEMEALRCGVSPSWITRHSVLFFKIVVKEFLEARKKKLEEAKDASKELWGRWYPEDLNAHRIIDRGKNMVSGLKSPFHDMEEFFYDEEEAIQKCDLSGPKAREYQNDLFVDFLKEKLEGTNVAFGDMEEKFYESSFTLRDINFLYNFQFDVDDAIAKLLTPPVRYRGEVDEHGNPLNIDEAEYALENLIVAPSEISPVLKKKENFEELIKFLAHKAKTGSLPPDHPKNRDPHNNLELPKDFYNE